MTSTMIHGDCLAVLPTFASSSVDLVLCDMPYGTTKCKWDSVLPLGRLWGEWGRVAKKSANFVLFSQSPFTHVLALSNIEALKHEIIWEKGRATGHLNANRSPMKAHENILVFRRTTNGVYNPQKTFDHERKVSRKRQDFSGVYGGQDFGDGIFYDSTERFPRSVVKFQVSPQERGAHPTRKPVELLKWLVKTYSNPGDTVLDNCMGSGATGEACAALGRDFVGVESDERFYLAAKIRIEAVERSKHEVR